MPSTSVNGTSIYYESYGDGPTLIYIHGGAMHPGDLRHGVVGRLPSAVASLEHDPLRIVFLHRRNFGHSGRVLVPYSFADLAADAVGVLDAAGAERAIVVGQSGGGPIALQVAIDFPERVAALCLADCGGPGRRRGSDAAVVAGAVDLDERAAFDSVRSALRNPPSPVLETSGQSSEGVLWLQEWHKDLVDYLDGLSDDELFDLWRASRREADARAGFAPKPTRLTMPACVIYGEQDAVVTAEDIDALRPFLPEAEYHCIPGAGHATIQMDPRAIGLFRDWVRRMIDA